VSTSFADDPRLLELRRVSEQLTGPDQPYEVVDEDVLGERLGVYRRRPRSLRDVLVNGAAYGERDCYVFGDGRRVSFVDLVQQVASVAAGLRDVHGVRAGDRVAVCAANCPEWLLAFWAVASLDAVLVAMNGWWTGTEMRTALDLATPTFLIMDQKRRARLDGDPGVPTVIVERDFAGIAVDGTAALPDTPVAEDDPFMLIFTSGTTGRPKAAVLSHRAVVAYLMAQSFTGARAAAMSGRPAPSGPPPTRLATYPLFHVSGLSMTVGSVMTGATSVWPLGKFDPAAVIALTKKEGIATWGGGTTHILRLLEHPDVETLDAHRLVSVGVGGSATPPEIIRRTEERFPHLTGTMSSGYGSTETGLLSFAANWMLRAEPDCVGPPLPTVAVRITDDRGDVLPDAVDGNIEARSSQSMLGYWHNDEADVEAILPGRWIRTGDFGRIEHGLLFIASRLRDLIIRGGENIYPFEIEYRLDQHNDVTEAAVFGVDDALYGEAVKAVVVVRPGVTLTVDELQRFCAETLASYKVPAVVEIRTDPLPRNATGKVMKQVLSGETENVFVED
jgi:acyl-CoA synthetase (AMP-forming)/AMP-acid ligase II